jgi:glycosyltransferase involved in cell wall biosynthesis
MLGWEFPPFISGGLGTACYGLTKGMSELGTEILLVLPRPVSSDVPSHVKFVGLHGLAESVPGMEELVKIRSVEVALNPYTGVGARAVPVGLAGTAATFLSGEGFPSGLMGQKGAIREIEGGSHGVLYGREIHREVFRYASFVSAIAEQEKFDVIHAHDWMTYPAGVAASRVSGKPLVVHVHSTEFDRSGENVNPWIYQIERAGMEQADRVIAVSRLTSRICMDRYTISEKKIHVVYNAMIEENPADVPFPVKRDEKVVLFLGRLTMQKGPEYFIAAAKKVLSKIENVKFIVAGSGDMMHRMIEMAAGLGIGHKVLFAGFLRGPDVIRAFRMADLYVMPSVSEPFGIAPLEALSHDVPVIISRQSGVSEVLNHVLKVDFWDINELANKMVAVLKYPPLQETLRENGGREVRKLKWIDSARKCVEIYTGLTKRAS